MIDVLVAVVKALCAGVGVAVLGWGGWLIVTDRWAAHRERSGRRRR